MNSPNDPYEPRLDLPAFVGQKDKSEWSRDEARQALDWTIVRLEVVPLLLRWLDIDPDQPCPDLLLKAGVKATPILRLPEYSTPGPNIVSTELKGHAIETDIGAILTGVGEALAYDLGLVIAACLKRSIPGLDWMTARGGKLYVSLNLPLLAWDARRAGFDPGLIGLNTARHAIRSGNGRRWADIYQVWLEALHESPS